MCLWRNTLTPFNQMTSDYAEFARVPLNEAATVECLTSLGRESRLKFPFMVGLGRVDRQPLSCGFVASNSVRGAPLGWGSNKNDRNFIGGTRALVSADIRSG